MTGVAGVPRGCGPAVVVVVLLTGLVLVAFMTGRLAIPEMPSSGSDPVGAGPAVGPPERLCEVDDRRVSESSGLVVDGGRLFTVNDSGSALDVYVLNFKCSVVDKRSYPQADPVDVEDLAIAPDGALWAADIGDNRASRSTVALYRMADLAQGSITRYPLAYEGGPRDAETLLLAPDGTPYIVTKSVVGASEVYAPAHALDPDVTTPLVRVAELSFRLTGGGGGPVGSLGSLLATGGSVAVDGTRMVVRTYTNAYVWDLVDGDVLGALRQGLPQHVDVADVPQGEAIALAADGVRWYTSSEGVPFPIDVQVVSSSG